MSKFFRRHLGYLVIILSVIGGQGAFAQAQINASEAASHIGDVATVCGTVASTKFASTSKGQPTFLNLDKPYPNHIFTAVIWGQDRSKFGTPELKYDGKRICVTGMIESYRSRPEVIVHAESQIKM